MNQIEDKLPAISTYRKYLNIASIRFNLSIDECRNKYGLYTTKQWLELFNQSTDLFEDYDNLPDEVKAVLDKYSTDTMTYEACATLVEKLEAIGYTCEYGLDAVPYDLSKK